MNDTIRVQELEISTIKEGLLETEAVKKYSAERGEKTKELDQNLKDREETINNLMLKIQELEEADRSIRDNETEELIKTYMLRIHELEEAERTRKAEGFMTSQEPDSTDRGERIKELDQNIKDREQTINALMLRIHELEEADRKRKQQRSTTSQDPAGSKPVPSVRKIIGNARAIEASLLESKVRIILLQAKGYIDNKEYPAAIEVISRAEDIMALELPSLEVLHGKVLYRKGRAQYELGFLPEAQQHFNKALKMGFDADCGEADGDCVRGWLDKARAAARASVRLGYPA